MRALTSILVGSAASLVVFSVSWSLFIVPHHSYGGDSRASQIGGTLLFFAFTIFPILLAALLPTMLTLEFTVIRKKKVRAPGVWRASLWFAVSFSALLFLTLTTETFGFAALACGLSATVAGAFLQQWIASSKFTHEIRG
jgi:hypothetical protein